jgi:hypothetical protein
MRRSSPTSHVPPASTLPNRYYPAFLNEKMAFGMIRYGPGGITAADIDNDGFYDLFVPDGVESKLFRNTGDGRFEDITAAAGLSGLDGVSVGIFADYDNDGFKDFFVSRTFKPNQLFHNNGNGTFTDVTAKSRIGEDCCTTVASWGDYDNDGLLDLYVGRYLDPRIKIPTTFYARNGEPNQLYHNNGDGTFSNVTEKGRRWRTRLVPRQRLGGLRRRRVPRFVCCQRLRPQDAVSQQPEWHLSPM